MKVKIKKLHPDAIIPKYAHVGDAGLDLTAVSIFNNGLSNTYECFTGISVEIPKGYVGLIFPRSSIRMYNIALSNSVGVIDSNYRGQIICVFKGTSQYHEMYKVGDRIAQLIILPYPQIEFTEVDELSTTDRGEGGFGSSGK